LTKRYWLIILSLLSGPAFAHSGGFDNDGCHTNRSNGDFHCHHSEAVAHYYLQKHAGEAKWYRAEVLKVIDGDSFRARASIWLDHLVQTNIRIRGIDTPEIKRAKCSAERKLGKRAKAALEKLLKKGVILHRVEYDKFGGRVLADVYSADFKNIGFLLVDAGLARFYDGRGPRGSWCE
jgi:endonuclease YncB( thermonuclease family)